jgi:hypothetical protein
MAVPHDAIGTVGQFQVLPLGDEGVGFRDQYLGQHSAGTFTRNFAQGFFASAGYGLNEISSTDDANKLAIFYNRHPLDRVPFEQSSNLMERRFWRGGNCGLAPAGLGTPRIFFERYGLRGRSAAARPWTERNAL